LSNLDCFCSSWCLHGIPWKLSFHRNQNFGEYLACCYHKLFITIILCWHFITQCLMSLALQDCLSVDVCLRIWHWECHWFMPFMEMIPTWASIPS
jgi:hypothetical protein